MSNQFSLFDAIEAISTPDEQVTELESATETIVDTESEIVITQSEQEALGQQALFSLDPKWKEMWTNMPDFEQKDMRPHQTINVHFRSEQDRRAFAALVNQNITSLTQAIWYPSMTTREITKRRWSDDGERRTKYPIYVISKGRWESRLTVKALERMQIAYQIVIEPQEFDDYARVIDAEKILTLPFSNLGQGSIPARNWCWEHSLTRNAERHWIVDDNISGWIRLHQNTRLSLDSSIAFTAIENFVDRYENIALAGPNYRFLGGTHRDPKVPPFYRNTRVYSCILIKNDIPYRWRGRYNEDTDLSIRALKDGWCTVLFNAIKINKQATMTMKGGNTDELYADDGRLKMAESLRDQHPDCVRITRKWDRWQHHVDYSRFKDNRFIEKQDCQIDQQALSDLNLIEERA